MAWEDAPFFRIDGPLYVPPPYGTMRGEHFFRGFKTMVRDLGGDCNKIFEQNDIDPAAAENPEYPLSCTVLAAVMEYCSKRFNDGLFGLHLAEYQDTDVFGCLTTLARTAPNLRAVIESMVEYVPVLHCPGVDLEAVTSSETSEFRWRPYGDIAADAHSNSHGLLLFVKFIESIGPDNFRPSYVRTIADISRKNIELMEDRFRCRVYANASASAIGFHISHLDRPLKTYNRMLFGLLKSYLSQVKNATNLTLEERVQRYVRHELSLGSCSLERCAANLGMTVRTLHRHLTQKGLKFSDVLEQQRVTAAKRALLETDYSIDEISNSLGYSAQSSFSRAFKRWTRMAPEAFRGNRHKRSIDPALPVSA